jgi:PIN domain nuclease of toxin-antitoxin system
VKLLLDTQLLLWAAGQPERLPVEARTVIDDGRNQLMFSAASLWEVAIKSGLRRADFRADARAVTSYDELRDELVTSYGELR